MNFFYEQLIPFIREQKELVYIYHLGDLFDSRSSINPFISLNCLLTSTTILLAALPTALIVQDENINVTVAPINAPINTWGFKTDKSKTNSKSASKKLAATKTAPQKQPEKKVEGTKVPPRFFSADGLSAMGAERMGSSLGNRNSM